MKMSAFVFISIKQVFKTFFESLLNTDLSSWCPYQPGSTVTGSKEVQKSYHPFL